MSLRALGLKAACVGLTFVGGLGVVRGQQTPVAESGKPSPSPSGAAAAGPNGSRPEASAEKSPAQKANEKEIQKKEQSQRIFGVYPEFSVTNRKNAAPLTPREKFHLFYKTAFDPFEFALAGLQAGIDQDGDTFPGYGEGLEGYGKRYAADFGDEVSAGFWSNFFWPTLLKEDPRYFRAGKGGFKRRFSYALTQEFVVHKDGGGRTFGYANVLGALSAGALSNAYHPEGDRDVGVTLRGAGVALLYGSLGGVVDEFWPDIHDHMVRRHKKNKIGSPAKIP